jgi:hypothetical protein
MGRSMKKIAIFVEGQTEQIFISQLVKYLSVNQNISVSILKIQGKQGERRVTQIKAYSTDLAVEYYFLIYDCGGDNQVKGDIVDNLISLQEENFSFVIGLRDLYPETNIIKLRHFLQFDLQKNSIPTHIILAVQEVEAWFIAEETHYEKISPKLTIEIVNAMCNHERSNARFALLTPRHPRSGGKSRSRCWLWRSARADNLFRMSIY